VRASLVLGVFAASCGSGSESTASEPGDELPIDGFSAVESIDKFAGIWVPVEVGGEPVDAPALGVYLQVVANDERVQVNGYDGCNAMSGNPT
jgi:hypothetical protein